MQQPVVNHNLWLNALETFYAAEINLKRSARATSLYFKCMNVICLKQFMLNSKILIGGEQGIFILYGSSQTFIIELVLGGGWP